MSLQDIARQVRRDALTITARAKAPHIASAFSCVDLLVALYFRTGRVFPDEPDRPDRDRIILSKGHAAAALYACLSVRGFYAIDRLDAFGGNHSAVAEHPIRGALPGIECSTGSLGHGLGLGSGMAVAAKLSGQSHRVFVVMSDGECNEGSVWEAALWAPAHHLNNLTGLIDFNRFQATGRSTTITAIEPLGDKWRAFGWDVHEVNGHDIDAVATALETPRDDRPRMIVAHTIKGKGVSFMEDNLEWHYRPPNPDDLRRALAELDAPDPAA